MVYGIPERDGPELWLPLRRLIELTKRTPRLPTLAVCEFMFMAHEHTPGGDALWLYKHIDSRRYLNLDGECRPWVYVPVRRWDDDAPGRYARLGSLDEAIANLELEQFGLDRERYVDCEICRELEVSDPVEPARSDGYDVEW